MMKFLLYFIIVSAVIFGSIGIGIWLHGPLEQKVPDYLHPERPDGVPVVNCDNDTIVWDWKYQVAYNENRLHFHMDSVRDCVILVVLEKQK